MFHFLKNYIFQKTLKKFNLFEFSNPESTKFRSPKTLLVRQMRRLGVPALRREVVLSEAGLRAVPSAEERQTVQVPGLYTTAGT